MLLVTVVYTICQTWSSERSNEVLHLRWGPTTHVQFWFAMLGGSCAFMHYFFLLKAFEGAPSTVLLPLVQARGSRACPPARLRLHACAPARLPAWPAPAGLAACTQAPSRVLPASPLRRCRCGVARQVASVSVLLGSSVVSLSRNEPWITPVQGLAYVLMFIGGEPRPTRQPRHPRHPRRPRHCAAPVPAAPAAPAAPCSRAPRLLRVGTPPSCGGQLP